MRQIITALLLLFPGLSFGQHNNTWIAFDNTETTLVGFKDQNGIIKIEPRFQAGFTIAHEFENIIAVGEDINGKLKTYYLTKSGKITGSDSIHLFDNSPDCESEGFIRFTDSKTGKGGLFNRNGDIVVPGVYSTLTSVVNGMVVGLKGATKKRQDQGEHYTWLGGKEMLIDTANNILIDDFKLNNELNFFSLLVSTRPNPDTIRRNFKAVNGKYFSFIDFDKEFRQWLKSSLLHNLTKENLLDATFKNITCWKEPAGWAREAKESFVASNYELIKAKLLQLNSKDCDYFISNDDLNPYIFTMEDYKEFFNNCGEPKTWLYPVKEIVITYKEKKGIVQDSMEFLRTDEGYKLVSLSIRKGEIQ